MKALWRKIRYSTSVAGLYLATLLFVSQLSPAKPFLAEHFFRTPQTFAAIPAIKIASLPVKRAIQGRPVKIIITSSPALRLELPVDPGYFDAQSATWNVSENHAQYAMPSMLANDTQGNTLVYGHNSWSVFGRLIYLQPDSTAQVITDNGHTFTYALKDAKNFNPKDTSVFKTSGAADTASSDL